MRLLGIDPGRRGAIAALARGDCGGWRVSTQDLPASVAELQDLLPTLTPVAFAVLEKPFYPPGIGIRSATVIAEAYGALTASLFAAGIPVREVRPVDWKRALNVPRDKAGARQQASMLFPLDAEQWTRAKEDGRAEAALIAWFGMRWV